MKTQTYQVRQSGKSPEHQKKKPDHTSSSFPVQTQQETQFAPAFNIPKGSIIANIQRSMDSGNYPYPTAPMTLQTKLTVGDRQEDQLPLRGKTSLTTTGIQRNFEENLTQAKGGGSPLDSEFREQIEPKMGADFSGVKVHTDSTANELSQSIQAKAFTTGQDIFFKQGEYNPHSQGGQEILAHELTHVVQQNGGNVTDHSVQRKPEHSISSAPQGTIQRIVDSELAKLGAIEFKKTFLVGSVTGKNKMAEKKEQAMFVLQRYNDYMHSGKEPGSDQNLDLLIAINLLTQIADASEQQQTISEIVTRLEKEQVLLKQYHEIQDAEMLGKLSSGQVNTVYKVLFANDWDAVWKQDVGNLEKAGYDSNASGEDKIAHDMAENLKISTQQPNLGSRNIAMYRLDQLLGTGVIPRTERATYKGNAGIAMDFVSKVSLGGVDKTANQWADQDEDDVIDSRLYTPKQDINIFLKPKIQQQLSNLQLLDAIAGQVDRHAGNVHVVLNENGQVVGIKGIDNDFAFGFSEADGQDFIHINQRKMPDFIDSTVADRIEKIDVEDIRKTLAGLLTDAEIEQTVKRFNTVKAYIMQLKALDNYFHKKATDKTAEDQGYIVSNWNQQTYDKQMKIADKKSGIKNRRENTFVPQTDVRKGNSYLYQNAMRLEQLMNEAPGLIGRHRR